jgi:flagellar basal-body rod protein FlgB
MSLLFDSTQLALGAALQGAHARQTALADNLANVDTPGYVRKDVDFHGALAAAMGANDPRAALAGTRLTTTSDGAGVVRADGSTVDVDAESAKLAANGLEYEQLASAARVRLDILRSAMGVA